MKAKLFSILLCILMIPFFSCKKMEFQNDISGTWKLLGASGGIAVHSIETHFTHLQLKKNNHYFIYRNDSINASGDYSLYSKFDSYLDKEIFEIKFNKGFNQDPKLAFPFDDSLYAAFYATDTLIFSEECSDCYSYAFVKQK